MIPYSRPKPFDSYTLSQRHKRIYPIYSSTPPYEGISMTKCEKGQVKSEIYRVTVGKKKDHVILKKPLSHRHHAEKGITLKDNT